MNQTSINIIGEKCCGCGVCKAVCPKKAVYSTKGLRDEFLYAANDACIGCGKCLRVCPAQNAGFHEESSNFYKA